MTSKVFTNLLKLSPIYACGRQVVQLMEDGSEKMIDFEVSGDDVKAAWELISISMSTYQKFKVLMLRIRINLARLASFLDFYCIRVGRRGG